jgi:phosphatidylglycerophosphatase A
VLCGLILFRFFDIVKPLFVRKMESLPAGWGIMMDDVLAGVYTNILLQAVLWFKWL